MKKLLLFFLVLVITPIFSQDYKLFTASSKKLFSAEQDPFEYQSLSFPSSINDNTDSVYFNLLNLGTEEIESDTCMFWTGPYCVKQNIPRWFGSKIIFDNLEGYKFFSSENKLIQFSFNTEVDGPIPFYNDSIQNLAIFYEYDDTLTVLDQVDSVRHFRIIHTDTEGEVINSELSNKRISIGKTFGLINFFAVDSFPQILKPIKLIGSKSPDAGFYQITYGMLYNFQPGDEIQYNEYAHYYGNYPPWYSYNRYKKLRILNREEINDSLIYTARRTIFYPDSLDLQIDTVTVTYIQSMVLSQIPFDYFDFYNRVLSKPEYCNSARWTYGFTYRQDLEYCAADTCWGISDAGGPPEIKSWIYVCGLGLYEEKSSVEGPDGYYAKNRIIYFKKNGESCGQEEVMSVRSEEFPASDIVISPNPANEYVRISSPVEIRSIYVVNASGDIMSTFQLRESTVKFNIRAFPSGLYVFKIILENEQIFSKKVMVFHD